MRAQTSDPLVSPVTNQELADWLVIDAADPLLQGILLTATSTVITYTGYDLIARDWSAQSWEWPSTGTRSVPSISRQNYRLKDVVDVPYAKLIGVDLVEVYGVPTTDFVQREDDIAFSSPVPVNFVDPSPLPALRIEYRAGYGETAADVPDGIKQAIKMIAAFIYEHRGACDAMDALKRSGAKELLAPFIKPTKLAVV